MTSTQPSVTPPQTAGLPGLAVIFDLLQRQVEQGDWVSIPVTAKHDDRLMHVCGMNSEQLKKMSASKRPLFALRMIVKGGFEKYYLFRVDLVKGMEGLTRV